MARNVLQYPPRTQIQLPALAGMGFDGSDTRGAVDMTVAASGGARSKYAITKDDIPALIVSDSYTMWILL